MISGTVFDVKRFALHDGKGLRSTLFLKGCPLTCPWCQNPEGLSGRIHLRWTPSKCIRCGLCIRACPTGTLSRNPDTPDIKINSLKCDSTGSCIEECPAAALSFDGRRISAREIAQELLRDKAFFDASGGGITLSGGEPLAQAAFTVEILRICRESKVHTAVETTLSASRSAVESLIPYTDLFLVDQKIDNPDDHRSILGVDSNRIRENLEFLLAEGAKVIVRIPLIPGFTSGEANLQGLGKSIAALNPQPEVELLNFNPLAENKYRLLGKAWPIPRETPRYTNDEMEHFAEILRHSGVQRIFHDE